ncbi:hypothetical protein HAX54_043072 [Datura stramonium]|uniref:Uncharacterized protein n=1 Tax=Datura stramonium TaxID=4076 RepID=A0ABS8SMT9_DATST|nr:hypothetical protein [Datura stramonium]
MQPQTGFAKETVKLRSLEHEMRFMTLFRDSQTKNVNPKGDASIKPCGTLPPNSPLMLIFGSKLDLVKTKSKLANVQQRAKFPRMMALTSQLMARQVSDGLSLQPSLDPKICTILVKGDAGSD